MSFDSKDAQPIHVVFDLYCGKQSVFFQITHNLYTFLLIYIIENNQFASKDVQPIDILFDLYYGKQSVFCQKTHNL